MKKLFFSALVASVALGGAFVSNANTTKKTAKTLTVTPYYQSPNCFTAIECDTELQAPTCESQLVGPVYEFPGCTSLVTPIGNRFID